MMLLLPRTLLMMPAAATAWLLKGSGRFHLDSVLLAPLPAVGPPPGIHPTAQEQTLLGEDVRMVELSDGLRDARRRGRARPGC